MKTLLLCTFAFFSSLAFPMPEGTFDCYSQANIDTEIHLNVTNYGVQVIKEVSSLKLRGAEVPAADQLKFLGRWMDKTTAQVAIALNPGKAFSKSLLVEVRAADPLSGPTYDGTVSIVTQSMNYSDPLHVVDKYGVECTYNP